MNQEIISKVKRQSRVLTDRRRWRVWRRAFHIWQLTPHQVAPNDAAQHTCQSCGTEFCGNYCPRCGQSSRVGRFSFRTAIGLFLDNWGLGNRSFFLTIRDLMVRPGYMIRDYVRGCQSAYFPPFQMFLLLASFSLLLEHGFSFQQEEHVESSYNELPTTMNINDKTLHFTMMKRIEQVPMLLRDFEEANPALFSLLTLLLLSAPLYVFFRRCPAIPDLRFSEHVVALVYASNTYSIYRLIATIIPVELLSDVVWFVALLMMFVALKQFTGYSKRRQLWYMFLTFVLFFLVVTLVTLIVVAIAYYSASSENVAFLCFAA